MQIIAFGYKKGSGKDTAGKFLDTMLRAENVRSCRASFADKLKDVAFQLYGWAGLKRGVYYETHYAEKEVILPKLGLTPREIWIQVGNKMREVYQDTWIDYVINSVSCDVIIVTDLRFQNEAQKLRERGAFLVNMHRPNITRGSDPAEIDLDSWTDWDHNIYNDSTLVHLNTEIKVVASLVGVLDD